MKTILAIIAISILAGLGSVYADTQDTIDIPFEFNGRICGLVGVNYVCEWDPNALNVRDIFENGTATVPNPSEVKSTPYEEPVIIIPEIEVGQPTRTINKAFDTDLEEFEEKSPTKNADKEYYELLKNLAQCRAGYAESRGVATDRWFDISYTWVNQGEAWLKSLDYTGSYGILKKAIEECQAIRTILNPVVLGPGYYERGQYFGKPQFYHGDIADKVPIWTQARVNEESNIGFSNLSYCETTKWLSLETKRYMGCPDPTRPDNIGATVTNGFITYQSDVDDRYIQYGKDHGVAQANEIIEQQLKDNLKQMNEVRKRLESLN